MITDNIILWDTKYGQINCKLKDILETKHISMYYLERITGIKYDVLKRYYDNQIIKFDGSVLARLCYSLNCEINDLLQYERSN